jgi:hypothetical protein
MPMTDEPYALLIRMYVQVPARIPGVRNTAYNNQEPRSLPSTRSTHLLRTKSCAIMTLLLPGDYLSDSAANDAML